VEQLKKVKVNMDKGRRRTLYVLLVIGIAALCAGLVLLFTYSG